MGRPVVRQNARTRGGDRTRTRRAERSGCFSIFYYFAISGPDSAAGSTSAVENAQVERREIRLQQRHRITQLECLERPTRRWHSLDD
jgi:hypothetical protein